MKGWVRHDVDPATADRLLRDITAVAGEGFPVKATAHLDNAGKVRRIEARYPDGWSIKVCIGADGSSTITQNYVVKITARKPS